MKPARKISVDDEVDTRVIERVLHMLPEEARLETRLLNQGEFSSETMTDRICTPASK